MRILLVVNSLGSGGAERVAVTLANWWTSQGNQVTLVATYSGRGSVFYQIDDRVEVKFLADLVRPRSRGYLTFFSRLGKLRGVIRDEQASVVVSLLTNVNIMTVLANAGLGYPLIACEHNNPLVDGRSLFWRLASRLLYPFASCVSVLTSDVLGQYQKHIPSVKKLVVLPNPIAPELFFTERNVSGPGKRFSLVGVGRLQPVKQFDLLIRVFARLAREFPDWDLRIWGEGSERERLEALVVELGLEDRVFLPGQTNELWTELMKADLFALSSRHEGLPMALMEAMALGVPVVAFDCPSGPRDLTENGRAGILVENGNIYDFASSLRSLMARSTPARKFLGDIGARSVKERFSLQCVMALWEHEFQKIGVRPER